MRMNTQYLINGRLDVALTPLDRGLAYGDGVFRTFPVRQGKVHCWERHYRQLSEDCKALGIVCPQASLLQHDVALICGETELAAVKIIVTRGEGTRGYAVPALSQPVRIVIKSAMPDYPEPHFTEGVRVHLCQLRLAEQPRLAGIKHLNRLENVLARMEWVDPKIADGVLLDAEGRVIECTMSNLFVRHGNTLTTPDLSRCGVAGVTRQRVLEMAPLLGLDAHVSNFDLDHLLAADEVIACNSLFGAWQVRHMGDRTWEVGTLAARLRNLLEQDE